MKQLALQEKHKESAKLGRNFLWMAWTGVVGIGNSVLVWVFMARMRDVEDVGRFTIVMGLYALFFNLNALGLMPYLVSELSRRKSSVSVREFISSSSVFLSISSILCAIAMSASSLVISGSYQVRMSALVLAFSLLPSNLITLSESAAIATGRMRFIAFVSTIENLLRTIIPIGLIWAGYNILAISASFAIIRIIAMLVHLVVNKVRLSHFIFCRDEFRKIVSVSPTFAGTGVMAALNWQAPLFMLAYFSTEIQSAEFGAASRFLIPVSILLGSYANAFQPDLTRRIAHEPRSSGTYLSKVTGYPLIIAVIAAIGSLFLSETALALLFGQQYVVAATTLEILVISIIPFCLVMVASRGLIALGMQRVDLYANIVGFIACVAAGLIVIPRYGALGAAIAQLVCFSVMGLMEVLVLSRKLGGFRIGRRAALSSGVVATLYLVIWNF
jgi:O-antigen/teichoic acid export membrane protein